MWLLQLPSLQYHWVRSTKGCPHESILGFQMNAFLSLLYCHKPSAQVQHSPEPLPQAFLQNLPVHVINQVLEFLMCTLFPLRWKTVFSLRLWSWVSILTVGLELGRGGSSGKSWGLTFLAHPPKHPIPNFCVQLFLLGPRFCHRRFVKALHSSCLCRPDIRKIESWAWVLVVCSAVAGDKGFFKHWPRSLLTLTECLALRGD